MTQLTPQDRRYGFTLLAVFGVVIGIITFAIVPQFAELYSSMGISLPLATRVLVSAYPLLGIAGGICAVVSFVGLLRSKAQSVPQLNSQQLVRRSLLFRGVFVGSMGLVVFIIVTALFYPLMSIGSH